MQHNTPLITALDLRIGESGQVLELEGPAPFLNRLRELGFIPGMRLYCQSATPFGDPRTYCVGPITVALRREEALCLKIEK